MVISCHDDALESEDELLLTGRTVNQNDGPKANNVEVSVDEDHGMWMEQDTAQEELQTDDEDQDMLSLSPFKSTQVLLVFLRNQINAILPRYLAHVAWTRQLGKAELLQFAKVFFRVYVSPIVEYVKRVVGSWSEMEFEHFLESEWDPIPGDIEVLDVAALQYCSDSNIPHRGAPPEHPILIEYLAR